MRRGEFGEGGLKEVSFHQLRLIGGRECNQKRHLPHWTPSGEVALFLGNATLTSLSLCEVTLLGVGMQRRRAIFLWDILLLSSYSLHRWLFVEELSQVNICPKEKVYVQWMLEIAPSPSLLFTNTQPLWKTLFQSLPPQYGRDSVILRTSDFWRMPVYIWKTKKIPAYFTWPTLHKERIQRSCVYKIIKVTCI